MLEFYIVSIIIGFCLFKIIQHLVWLNKLPPGPIGLPILGRIPFLGQFGVYSQLESIEGKYGDVISMRLGDYLYCFLTTYDAVREAFIDNADAFSERPKDFVKTLQPEYTNKGIVWSHETEVWKLLRRFTLTSLRDFGLGKKSNEGKIKEECDYLKEEFIRQKGKPMNTHGLITNAVSNITCNLVFGDRYDYSDEKFTKLIFLMNHELFAAAGPMNALNQVPMLKHLPSFKKFIKARQISTATVMNFVQELVEEHKRSRTAGEEPRDFLDSILDETSGNAESKNVFDIHLINVVTQLFIAGTDTTASTIQWVIFYLLKFPEYQDIINQEIVEVAGSAHHLSYETRHSTPKLESFIMEVQRICNIAPISLPHTVTKDVTFRNYLIPAGTIVHGYLRKLHLDPKYWDSPKEFRPSRFIMEDGKVNYRHPSFLPFSTGKRVCIGETLAKTALYLFTASLVNNFHLRNPPGVTSPNENVAYGLTRHPAGFDVCVTLRN